MRPAPKGWCPGALTPMQSGDGLIVRIRPRAGRLSAAQVTGLCQAAIAHGSGLIDLTSRANLQIRGVQDAGLEALQTDLDALNLLDADPEIERRRNILTAALREPRTEALAAALESRLADLPDLPAKFGFAVDCGAQRYLADASADIRIEASATGLLIRADGADTGRATTQNEAIDTVIALADWFAAHKGPARRMRDAVHALPPDWQGTAPTPTAPPLAPGPVAHGMLLGAAFGSIDAAALADLMAASHATGFRATPSRLFLLEGAQTLPAHPFIAAPGDPLLQTDACPGAPYCASASVETRALARQLAKSRTSATPLHVSGCAKGCARPRPAALTLVGHAGLFDLVTNACSWDEPARRGLNPQALMDGTEQL